MSLESYRQNLKNIDDKLVAYFHTQQERRFKHFIRLFSINPKLIYIFFLIINFVYLNNSILKNLILFFICDILVFVLKRIIKRSRPEVFTSSTLKKFTGLGPDRYSFPSAHTFTAFQIVPISIMIFGGWGFIILAYAVLVGLSRMFLKHHYFTDVIGGMVLGLFTGLVNIAIFK